MEHTAQQNTLPACFLIMLAKQVRPYEAGSRANSYTNLYATQKRANVAAHLCKDSSSCSSGTQGPEASGVLPVLGTCLLILSCATLMSSSCWNHSPPPPRPPHRPPPPPRPYPSCQISSWFSLELGLSRQHQKTHHLLEP